MLDKIWIPKSELTREIENAEKLANELKRTITRIKRAKY
jgi:hypothetical protein